MFRIVISLRNEVLEWNGLEPEEWKKENEMNERKQLKTLFVASTHSGLHPSSKHKLVLLFIISSPTDLHFFPHHVNTILLLHPSFHSQIEMYSSPHSVHLLSVQDRTSSWVVPGGRKEVQYLLVVILHQGKTVMYTKNHHQTYHRRLRKSTKIQLF